MAGMAGGMGGMGGAGAWGGQRPQTVWMSPAVQALPAGCPAGLEFLLPLGQVFIRQQIEMMELLTGYEGANRYEVINVYGQRIFMAMEMSEWCERQCCGPQRGFEMALLNAAGTEVMRLKRAFQPCSCCGCCCQQELHVFAPPGQLIAVVKQECEYWKTRLGIQDAAGHKVLQVLGPCCVCGYEEDFQLLPATDAAPLGRIAKLWSGLVKELFTDADNFGVSFPTDLDVKLKAAVVAAAILIDFMHYESSQKQGHYGYGYGGYGGYGYGYGGYHRHHRGFY